MTHSELKRLLEKLVSTYFGGTDPVWGMVKSVNPSVPLVVLNLGSIIRHYQPINLNSNGVPVGVYPSKTTLQIDLYTKGRQTSTSSGVMAAFDNTAVNDLTDFLNFINSPFVDNWCGINDISLLANQVRDLTGLINDTSWDYRAMLELEIGFTQTAAGFSGIMFEDGAKLDDDGNPLDAGDDPFTPTPSGGRTQDLADDFTGWFEAVETEYEKEESSNVY